MNANRSSVRSELAALLSADGVIGAFAQAVYGYRLSEFGAASPVVIVTSAGTERGPKFLGTTDTDVTMRFKVFALTLYSGTGVAEQTAEARADWLDVALSNVIRANRAGSSWHYLDYDGPSSVQVGEEGGVPFYVEIIPLKARVIGSVGITDARTTPNTVQANRTDARTQLAALMAADAGLSNLAQAFFGYHVSDFLAQSPTIVVTSAGTGRTARKVGGAETDTALRLSVWVFVAYASNGWDEEDAEARLDAIDAALGDFVQAHRADVFWDWLDFEGPSAVSVSEEGGVPYFVEQYTLVARGVRDADGVLTDSAGVLLMDSTGEPLTE